MFKRIMTATVLGASALGMMAANATTSGLYITGQAGYANNHLGNHLTKLYRDDNGPSSFKIGNAGLAGRLAIGYQFNPYFATELGYLRLANQKGKDDGSTGDYIGTETLKQQAIDVAAKGILPINDKFNVYGKLGVAYLSSTVRSNFDGTKQNQNKYFGLAKHQWAPEAGVGVSYNVTPNMFVDASWTHIQPIRGKNKPGNVDFAAVGIGYSFG